MAQPMEKRRWLQCDFREDSVNIERACGMAGGRLRPNPPIPEEMQAGGFGGLVKHVYAVLGVNRTPLSDAMPVRRRVEEIP